MEISVIGMGYVGVPTAALLAELEGIKVTGIQRRSQRSGWKIDHINSGRSPIGGEEPGLEELIKKVVANGSFHVTDDITACANADAILIDVQTPVDEQNKPKNDSLVQVCKQIGPIMKKGTLIIVESTVAPGTTEHIVKPILEEKSGMRAGTDFNLAYSYERVMVGRLLHNLKNMPRIVGGLTPECAKRSIELYRKIVKAELYPTDITTAELSKVTENAYRDVNIAFANEIALICESLGVNVHDVRKFVNSLPHDPSDPSKNPYRMMHIPGAGVGGHCLPKDPWLLKHALDEYGRFKFTPNILVESRKTNDYMPHHMKQLIVEALEERGVNPRDSRIALLGLSFLENSDDTRNSPAITLYNMMKGKCKEIIVHDPYVKEYKGINLTDNLEKALKKRDCIAIVTKHNEYYDISLDHLKETLSTPIIIDGRNVFNPRKCRNAGFTYKGIGIG